MCLSIVYIDAVPLGEPLCKNVARVENKENQIVFTDILGRQTTVNGIITSIDLMENTIKVKED